MHVQIWAFKLLKLKTDVESSQEIISELPKREDHCVQIIYTKQMEHFVDCIKTRTPPTPGIL